MIFDQLPLDKALLRALSEKDYKQLTPIQEEAILPLLQGKDVIGYAQTGTGKTAAYLLPLLQKLTAHTTPASLQALILVPTRELTQQIGTEMTQLGKYLSFRHAFVYGGVPLEPQIEALEQGLEILIATPGRLLDLMDRGVVPLSQINTLIIDEADRMVDMGFLEDMTRIFDALPADKQSMLFSATTSAELNAFIQQKLKEPTLIRVNPESSTTELVEQKVYYIERKNKINLLLDYLRRPEIRNAIIFTKTRRCADELYKTLAQAGIDADRIHSDRSQLARENVLSAFRNGELTYLIATDIAARGIDISHLSHIFNYELPQSAETFVHRVGRTGRAGQEGIAITFCAPDEKAMLGQIQKLIRKCIPVVEHHTYATLSLKKELEMADQQIQKKNEDKKVYKGNKSNGDYYRRLKREQRKKK